MNGEAEKQKLKTKASTSLTKDDGAGYLFAVKLRNESFQSHRKEERMRSPDLLFAPFVSGHCIGDERSFSVPSGISGSRTRPLLV